MLLATIGVSHTVHPCTACESSPSMASPPAGPCPIVAAMLGAYYGTQLRGSVFCSCRVRHAHHSLHRQTETVFGAHGAPYMCVLVNPVSRCRASQPQTEQPAGLRTWMCATFQPGQESCLERPAAARSGRSRASMRFAALGLLPFAGHRCAAAAADPGALFFGSFLLATQKKGTRERCVTAHQNLGRRRRRLNQQHHDPRRAHQSR